jgi:hypothetical protein
VVQQVPEPDSPVWADSPGQPPPDGVVESERVLGHVLHDEGRHEALRDASDPEAVVGPRFPVRGQVGVAGLDDGRFSLLLEQRDDSGDLGRRYEPVVPTGTGRPSNRGVSACG